MKYCLKKEIDWNYKEMKNQNFHITLYTVFVLLVSYMEFSNKVVCGCPVLQREIPLPYLSLLSTRPSCLHLLLHGHVPFSSSLSSSLTSPPHSPSLALVSFECWHGRLCALLFPEYRQNIRVYVWSVSRHGLMNCP